MMIDTWHMAHGTRTVFVVGGNNILTFTRTEQRGSLLAAFDKSKAEMRRAIKASSKLDELALVLCCAASDFRQSFLRCAIDIAVLHCNRKRCNIYYMGINFDSVKTKSPKAETESN